MARNKKGKGKQARVEEENAYEDLDEEAHMEALAGLFGSDNLNIADQEETGGEEHRGRTTHRSQPAEWLGNDWAKNQASGPRWGNQRNPDHWVDDGWQQRDEPRKQRKRDTDRHHDQWEKRSENRKQKKGGNAWHTDNRDTNREPRQQRKGNNDHWDQNNPSDRNQDAWEDGWGQTWRDEDGGDGWLGGGNWADDGWNPHVNKGTDKSRDGNNEGWGGAGDWGADDGWNTNPKKNKSGKKDRANYYGAWGDGVDQDKMETYHQQLLKAIARAAPPPKGPEFGPLPSRTLALARKETDRFVTLPGAPGNGETFVKFVDSGGAALKAAERALYSRERLAIDRLHWLFSPVKDHRVHELLTWIHSMSFGLAAFGVAKFLETGERGALITNVEYRAKKAPYEPAFDWFTWPAANATFDRTLQQSLAYYDPEKQVVILVFLLSRSQSSMAIWRRKINIPSSLRAVHGEAMHKRKEELDPMKMVIRVDDAGRGGWPIPPAASQPVSVKKKWFRWAV